eukprot:1138963-Pelagomonas_calceolata.AAC.6
MPSSWSFSLQQASMAPKNEEGFTAETEGSVVSCAACTARLYTEAPMLWRNSCAEQAEIRKAVQGTARGRAATPTQRQQINQLVMELEKCNPKPVDPALSVNGWWALLYQGG